MTFEVDDDRSLIHSKIETQEYALSDVRDLINEKICEKASDDILMFSYCCTKTDLRPLQNVAFL